MIPLGLSADEQARFEAGLATDHQIKVQVTVTDLDHNTVGKATGKVLSGQVDIDASEAVKRSCQLEVLDPGNDLNLDSGRAWEAGLFADRMIQVHYGVWSHQYPHWVNVPVFTGPITSLKRNGETVSITAHDKASLLLGPCSMNRTWPKGARKTDVLKGILAFGGESWWDIPGRPDKMTSQTVITSMDQLWLRAEALANTFGDVRLLYNGRGFAVLRPRTSEPRWRFRKGTGGTLLTHPSVGHDLSEARNLVVVTGGVPAGAKRPIRVTAEAPADHPLAPARIGRMGGKRWLREDITDEAITSKAAAEKLARNTLAEKLVAGYEVSCETMVIPHLEPHDVVIVGTGDQEHRIALGKFSIPLTADGRMTIGKHMNTRKMRRERATVVTRRVR